MDIREARTADAPALEELFAALGYPAEADDISARLDGLLGDDTYATWVVTVHDEVVGLAAGHLLQPIEHDQPAAQLVALVTAPDHKGTGIGSALCVQFETWARAAGARRAIVTSGSDRKDAHRFYKHQGYAPDGVRLGKILTDA